jgi:hypothetical protein
LREDDSPLEQRAHDAESAYPKNDQPEGDPGADNDRREGDMT